ncbi:P-loop containing nucleoside triphosphate hydrolase protein [Fistulina hepatica ATCC 64428]|uniref:p-loop containing nucleoside triphosphate hydrolase protein n=1 Tax=Fistulina hepatica ATCC 64428 TaxID=1128425 RepID=A0A0D7AAN5_9AGAR|nr:P-loop containing nucleoside triphosphate hydrolase protein [Fistulina hepatica ATCC 64428]
MTVSISLIEDSGHIKKEEWTLKDRHEENISFTAVKPVDIHVRHLSVDVSIRRSFAARLKRRYGVKVDVEAHGAAAQAQNADGQTHGIHGDDREVDDPQTNAWTKRILDDISADFPRCSLSAIIGGSGSGKTTLLNMLSRRMGGSNLSLSGTALYNGSPRLSDVTYAYVMQTDTLLPMLTVRETLRYAAALRLPSVSSATSRAALVEQVILELGLKECADTPVGDGDAHRGCSGGERRRVSIGVQLLANPSVLFLDEPTTGLDATSAYQLVRTLRSLAAKGRTIICTVHQPRHDIYFLFDRVTLLSRSAAVYSGLTANAIPWMEKLLPGGFVEHLNPADYLIQVAAVDTRTPEAQSVTRRRRNMLVQAWKAESSQLYTEVRVEVGSRNDSIERPPHSVSYSRQIRVLTSRTILSTFRDPMGLTTAWVEAVLMGLVCGLIYLQLPETLSGIRSRESALYTVVGLQSYLILLYEIWRIVGADIAVFDREHSEGVVDVIPWVISRRLARGLLEDIVVPFLFSITNFFLCGFTSSVVHFFKFYAVVLLDQYVSVSFAMMCAAITRDFSLASLIGNLASTFITFSCGFFVVTSTIPVYVRWIRSISFMYYAFGALVSNEFTGRFYDCPYGDAATDPQCLQYQGNWILDSLSVTPGWYTVPLCAMLVFVAFFNIGSILLLHFLPATAGLAKVRSPQETDAAAGKEKMAPGRAAGLINVDLANVALSVNKLTRAGSWREIPILNGVTTRFEAGKVNVIMGPSGSGKSSLLSLIAQRLRSTPLERYHADGALLLNGTAPDESTIRALCSYVTQDDNALLPYLTVREMLRFAAGLRLSKSMSAVEKTRRAEEVIKMLGLSDCADNLIGSEFLKGISGGEKRRVSIAVQILTEPRILIADEPTSGLDAFTASSIMEVLTGLANEGRTVIITIHQSRSELFNKFGNLLLLAKGGRMAYSGPTVEMISHFGKLGYLCPRDCNPSDWALDLISVDLRSAQAEEETRTKVDALIVAFQPTRAVYSTASEKVGLANLSAMKKEMAPLYIALPILLRRGWLNFRRQPNLAIARIGQVLGLGTVLALFFAPLGRSYIDASSNIIGAVRECALFYFVGMLQNVALYPIERGVFYKAGEHADRAYSVEAFMLSYTILEVPFEIVSSLLFSLLGAIATNLRRDMTMYFSLGIIFNTLFESTGFALNITSVILSVGTFMAGVMSLDMPSFFRGINYISPLKYSIATLMPYTLRGVQFTCTESQRLSDGQCPLSTGEQVLDLYNLNIDPRPMLGVLGGITVAYRLVAYLILKLTKSDLGKYRQGHHRLLKANKV